MPIGLATLRIIKPGEEGLLRQIAHCEADVVLVRNLATIGFFGRHAPETTLVGDYSLNVANELTADLFRRQGLERLVPSYDLNWEQLVALLGADRSGLVRGGRPSAHSHVSHGALRVRGHAFDGHDYRDCGRPCDRHRVELRDRVGSAFPLVADTGCRNTVYNSVAQCAAELVPRMLAAGLRHLRVELLRETPAECGPLLDRYSRVLCRPGRWPHHLARAASAQPVGRDSRHVPVDQGEP